MAFGCPTARQKVVGYEVQRCPAWCQLGARKGVLLQDSLGRIAATPKVDLEFLRAMVGVWLRWALLRRELLSVPAAVLRFMDVNEGCVVP